MSGLSFQEPDAPIQRVAGKDKAKMMSCSTSTDASGSPALQPLPVA
jgi:hypothetical protein